MRPRAPILISLALTAFLTDAQTRTANQTRLPGHRPAWATPAQDRGPLPGATLIHLILALARTPSKQSAFNQLLEDQQNPASPRFHQWLTPEQIGEQFGPPQQDLDTLTTWLHTQHLTIDAISPARTHIQLTASADVVSAAFQAPLHLYANHRYAPTTNPIIPTPLVAYISGLVQTQFHTSLTRVQAAYNLTSGSGATLHFLAPADFATAYNITPTYAAKITGLGQKVAVLGGSRLLASDLTKWAALSGIPAAQPNYIVPPGATFSDPGIANNGDQAEGTLDFERVYGTAPGVQVDQLISANWLNGTVTESLLLYAINTLRDPILSLSFGSCEAQQTSAYVQYESGLFAQAAAQGIAVFASSGDAGVAGCEAQGQTPPASQLASISDICASPYVTCVGGTQFSDLTATAAFWSATNDPANHASLLTYIPEGAWNEPTTASGATTLSATGGGRSTIIPKPTFQSAPGVPQDGFRDIPDLSFSASTHNAYFACLAYDHADCLTTIDGFGGTSASAPSMAGIAALLNQRLGSPQGSLNPLFYRLATSAPTVFHDVNPLTSGVATCSVNTPSTCNNSVPGPTTLTGGLAGYPLTPGYDLATGLGSLDVTAFLNAAANSLIVTPPTNPAAFTLTPASTALPIGTLTNQIAIASTTNFTGSITFTCAVTPITAIPPTCAVNPATVPYPTLTSTTVTILTAAPHAAFNRIQQTPGAPSFPALGKGWEGTLLCFLLPALLTRRRARALLPLLILLTACGSGTKTLTGGTTPGTYTITVTGNTTTTTFTYTQP